MYNYFEFERVIDFDVAQHESMTECFPEEPEQRQQGHREEILPPDLEEVYEPNTVDFDEGAEDSEEHDRPLSEREKRELFREHRNLSHPRPAEFARALRHAGARKAAIRYVLKEMRCPTCESRVHPLPPRPGLLPRCLRFNQCVGIDCLDLEVRSNLKVKALNVICWGTGLQIIHALWNGLSAAITADAFKHCWVKHYGYPETLVHDQGTEFMGRDFQNALAAAGVMTIPIDSQSPWQNGKTERAGDSFKQQLWNTDEEAHIEGRAEMEAAISECCDARNRYCNRSGFSAHQRVFGSSLRLPGSLLSDDPIDRLLLASDPYTEFKRSNEIRSAAQSALFRQNTTRSLQAAKLARPRSQPRDDIKVGDTVMVWRNNRTSGKRGWTGPGTTIAISPTKTSLWISMRGCLLKCSAEQTR